MPFAPMWLKPFKSFPQYVKTHYPDAKAFQLKAGTPSRHRRESSARWAIIATDPQTGLTVSLCKKKSIYPAKSAAAAWASAAYETYNAPRAWEERLERAGTDADFLWACLMKCPALVNLQLSTEELSLAKPCGADTNHWTPTNVSAGEVREWAEDLAHCHFILGNEQQACAALRLAHSVAPAA